MIDVVEPKKERTSKKLNLGTFSTSSATEEILNSFRWIPIVFTWHFLQRILMILSNLR